MTPSVRDHYATTKLIRVVTYRYRFTVAFLLKTLRPHDLYSWKLKFC
jgi:hypothetical protein